MGQTRIAALIGTGALALLIISACATDNGFQANGSDRANGLVQLSYQYVLSDRPVLDWVVAQRTAEARCASWGYARAQRSEDRRRSCLTQDIFGRCKSYRVNVAYQCTDDAASQSAANY